jgi:hypothetical protein
MPVFNDIENILPVLGFPSVIITLLSICRQIHEATLAALKTGWRFYRHSLFSPIQNP